MDRRNILCCIALFLLAAATVNPTLETGIHDDWAYTHMARDFAASGHFVYNGWPAMILIPQIVWAAGFIKVFGFSFLVVRLSTVVLGVFLIPVLYNIGRESGLAPEFATFATLLTMLSPLVMLEAVSFMSDVPALFLLTLCFYGGIKSCKATSTKICVLWAGLITLAGILSGLDRQIDWLAPLLFLPAVAWIQRHKRDAVVWLGAAWLAVIAAVVSSLLWFQAQPYTFTPHTLDVWKHTPLYLVTDGRILAIQTALTTALILLPLLAGYVLPGFKAVRWKIAVGVFVGAVAAALAVSSRSYYRVPCLGSVLTEYGPGHAALGSGPVLLGSGLCTLLTALVFVSCAGCGLELWKHREAAVPRLWRDPVAPALGLGFLFAVASFVAEIYYSVNATLYDRYLIPLLPLAGVPLLRYIQVHVNGRVSRWSWALLALFALYGVGATHDLFAASRAGLAAARTLEHAGIPRTEVMAGLAYDGWTQLEAAGYVNNPWIENPPGTFRDVTCAGPETARYRPQMTAIRARYFVALSHLPGMVDAPTAPLSYSTWLPPSHRRILIQELPGGGYAGCTDVPSTSHGSP